jgi:rhodanese-related sulfurtransferase
MGSRIRCLVPEIPSNSNEENCSEIGILGIIPGIVGCIQANEVLKILLNLGSPLSGELLSIDFLNFRFIRLPIKKIAQIFTISELGIYEPFSCRNEPNELEVLAEQLKALLRNAQNLSLIDIRESDDFKTFNIEGSINIPFHKIRTSLDSIPRNSKVVMICNYGTKSSQTIKHLRDEYGFQNLYNLKGGIIEWLKRINQTMNKY